MSGQMHGLVALDADEQVLRPAILWNDQRTGEQCAEIEERIGLSALIAATGNRALTGFTAPEAAVAARARARRLRADRAHPAAEGLRPPAALRRAGDRRRRRLRHAALRRRAPALERRGVLGAGDRHGLAAARARVARGLGGDERRHPGRGRGRRPGRRALGVGVVEAGAPLSVVLGTSGVVFCALPEFAADEEARVHSFCHAVPETWHAMGVMLSAAGSLAWLRNTIAPAGRVRRAGEGGRGVGAGGRGARRSCPTWPASARRTPTRTRAGPSPACRCATTAGRSCAPCSRASPSACATRST